MPRISIYVPDDLRARMGKVEDANWSQVACRAFELKLGELAASRQEKTMDNVIERLRASKLDAEDEFHKEGREMGEEWAKGSATFAELRGLDKAIDNYGTDWDRILHGGEYGFVGLVADMLRVDYREAGNSPIVERVNEMEGIDPNEPEFIAGFVDGALSVYREVESKI